MYTKIIDFILSLSNVQIAALVYTIMAFPVVATYFVLLIKKHSNNPDRIRKRKEESKLIKRVEVITREALRASKRRYFYAACSSSFMLAVEQVAGLFNGTELLKRVLESDKGYSPSGVHFLYNHIIWDKKTGMVVVFRVNHVLDMPERPCIDFSRVSFIGDDDHKNKNIQQILRSGKSIKIEETEILRMIVDDMCTRYSLKPEKLHLLIEEKPEGIIMQALKGELK